MRLDFTWAELKQKLGIVGEIRDITLMKPKKIRIWLLPEKDTGRLQTETR